LDNRIVAIAYRENKEPAAGVRRLCVAILIALPRRHGRVRLMSTFTMKIINKMKSAWQQQVVVLPFRLPPVAEVR
jgi:hypothetical protein